MYLLDTNTISELMKQNQITWKTMLKKNRNSVFLCEVVVAEIYFGLSKLGVTKRRDQLHLEFTKIIDVLDTLYWDRDTSKIFGELKSNLTKKGTIIADLDISIAAHAMRYGCLLITSDVSDFGKIKELQTESWKKQNNN